MFLLLLFWRQHILVLQQQQQQKQKVWGGSIQISPEILTRVLLPWWNAEHKTLDLTLSQRVLHTLRP